MSKKSFILSSAGLKNIIIEDREENKFRFHFGDEILTTNKILAAFLCPTVSRLLQIDPTIEDIYFPNDKDISTMTTRATKSNMQPTLRQKVMKIFTKNTISQLSSILKGEHISITKEESKNLRLVSIFLSNDDLYNEMNDLYPIESIEQAKEKKGSKKEEEKRDQDQDQEQLEYYIDLLFMISEFHAEEKECKMFDIIEYISSHFYLIDKTRLQTLPIEIIYQIISNPNLRLETEDSLFELMNEILEEKYEQYEETTKYSINNMKLKKNDFYENIEITQLSEEKFDEFIEMIDVNEMSFKLWNQIKSCFYTRIKRAQVNETRYINNNNKEHEPKQLIEYDGNTDHSFRGIIYELSTKYGGNVDDKNIIKITSSSIYSSFYLPKHSADFNDNQYFHSKAENSSWLQYDFKERKICPTHYSMRNSSDCNSSPRSWVLESSNSGQEEEWEILDEQRDTAIFMPSGIASSHTFKISTQQSNKYYRYLRIRTTSHNNNNCNYFAISSIEFFGFIDPQI